MTTRPQPRSTQPPPEHQLSLPLTPVPNLQHLTLPEVWRSLSPAQQQHLFQQMVQACRKLASHRVEVHDEPS